MPVYNAEIFLDKNLLLFKNLKRKDVELLIINDGSNDKSLEKIKSYSIDNCVIINQENHGVSYSRNVGIEGARGKYISFLDCDDFLNDEIFEILDRYVKGKYDVIRYGFNFYDATNYIPYKLTEKKILYKKNDILKLLLETMSTFKNNSVWNQFIRRDLLIERKLRFNTTHKYAEDLEFNVNLILNCNSVCVLPMCLYNYYVNDSGITKSINYNDVVKCTMDAIDVYTNNIKISIKYNIVDKKVIKHSVNEITGNVKKMFLNKNIKFKEKMNFINKVQKMDDIHYLKKIIKEYKLKITIFDYLLIFSKIKILIFMTFQLWGNIKKKE